MDRRRRRRCMHPQKRLQWLHGSGCLPTILNIHCICIVSSESKTKMGKKKLARKNKACSKWVAMRTHIRLTTRRSVRDETKTITENSFVCTLDVCRGVRGRAAWDAFKAGTRWIYNFPLCARCVPEVKVAVVCGRCVFPWQREKIHVFFIVVFVGFVPFSKTESLNSLCLAFIYSICAHGAIILWPLAKHENYVQWKCYRHHVSCTFCIASCAHTPGAFWQHRKWRKRNKRQRTLRTTTCRSILCRRKFCRVV